MVDIIIKSYNRPYYLEKCIRSIYQYVSGEFQIKILDNGTPQKYLDKIGSLFPEAVIAKSPFYEEKSLALLDHVNGKKKYSIAAIPSRFWLEEIKKSTDIFLLLEDDIWITAPIHTAEISDLMATGNIVTIKLSWLGNPDIVMGEKKPLGHSVEQIKPVQLVHLPVPVLKPLFYNKFKLTSVFTRLGLIDKNFVIPFYSLYAVASAFFRKDYWLYLWQDAPPKVDENEQLLKAVAWLHAHPESVFAKTTTEATQTSFVSSTSNIFEDVKMDMIKLNHLLNEAWWQGRLNAMENFPADFSIPYIKQLIDSEEDISCSSAEWLNWVHKFKEHFREIGCAVD